MSRYTIAVLPGDGIGPEVTAEAVRVLVAAAELSGHRLDLAEYPVGAAGVAAGGGALPAATRGASSRMKLRTLSVAVSQVSRPLTLADAACP